MKIGINCLDEKALIGWLASRSLGEDWCARQDSNLRPTD